MKPITRGYSHQIAFYISLAACFLLLAKSYGERTIIVNVIYCVSLIGLYGVSALYHCHLWSHRIYIILRRIDHAAIFILIAGTATPICLLGLKSQLGWHLLLTMWVIAAIGMLVTLFWTHAPKWIRASLYVSLGWLTVPFIAEIKSSMGVMNMWLLIIGGIFYTVGALIYALKRPVIFPRVFGFHELFHLFVVIGSGFHFSVIYSLVTS